MSGSIAITIKYFELTEKIAGTKYDKKAIGNLKEDDIQRILDIGGNFATTLPKGWVDIDIDNRNLASYLDDILPRTLTFGKNGLALHRIYKITDEVDEDVFIKSAAKKMDVEIRHARQTVLPPSVVNEEAVDYINVQDPMEIAHCNLERMVRLSVFSYYMDHGYYPSEGFRDSIIVALIGSFIRHQYPLSLVQCVLIKCAKRQGDMERVNDITGKIKALKGQHKLPGFASIKKLSYYNAAEFRHIVDIITVKRRVVKDEDKSAEDVVEDFMKQFCYIEEFQRFYDIENRRIKTNMEMFKKYEIANRYVHIEEKKVNVLDLWGSLPEDKKFKRPALSYLPGEDIIQEDSINEWRPSACLPVCSDAELNKIDKFEREIEMIKPVPGSIYPAILLIQGLFQRFNDKGKLVLDQAAYQWFMSWLAYPLQHPGTRTKTVLMCSTIQGTGKGTVGQIMQRIYGENFVSIHSDAAFNSQFNSFLCKKQFIMIDEVKTGDSYKDLSRLMHWITEPTLHVNKKFQPEYEIDNTANFYLTTNHEDALPLMDSDRRFFVWNIEFKASQSFFKYFYDWLDNKNGASYFYDYLLRLPLSTYDPYAEPPITEAKEMSIEDSRPTLVLLIEAMELPDIITAKYVCDRLNIMGYKHKLSTVGRAIRKCKFLTKREIRVKPQSITIRRKDKMHRIWVIKNYLELWNKKGVTEIIQYLEENRVLDDGCIYYDDV